MDRRTIDGHGTARTHGLNGTHHAGGMDVRRPDAIERRSGRAALELDQGYYAVVSQGEGQAEQVTTLPLDADLVILRRPIAGG